MPDEMGARTRYGHDWTPLVDVALRRLRGLSNAEAARRTGISANTISQWRWKRAHGEPIVSVHRASRDRLRLLLQRAPGGVPAAEGAPSARCQPSALHTRAGGD